MFATPEFDLLIVGSGPSGAHAAMEAVASGRKVALLEIGYSEDRQLEFDPSKTFSEIRRTDPNQRAYFLGEDPVTALRNQARAGPNLTPGRQYRVFFEKTTSANTPRWVSSRWN